MVNGIFSATLKILICETYLPRPQQFFCKVCKCHVRCRGKRAHAACHPKIACHYPNCQMGPFATKSAVNRHVQVFHLRYRYHCPYCPRAFATTDNVKKHSRRFHKSESQNFTPVMRPPIAPQPAQLQMPQGGAFIPDFQQMIQTAQDMIALPPPPEQEDGSVPGHWE